MKFKQIKNKRYKYKYKHNNNKVEYNKKKFNKVLNKNIYKLLIKQLLQNNKYININNNYSLVPVN